MFDVFISSTLKCAWNVQFNLQLHEALKSKGVSCYLPQTNTDQLANREKKFSQNIEGIKSSRLLVAVGAHESPNWGAEVGFAFGIKKPILILAEQAHEIPLMASCMGEVFLVSDLDNPGTYLTPLVNKIQTLVP